MKEYDKKIKSDDANISLLLNRAFLFFFTEGDYRAKVEYEKISHLYSDNELVKNMKDNFYSFERSLYINSLFVDCNGN